MTAAYRLKGFGLLGGGVAATLALYLVSVQVAAERTRLEQVSVKIVEAERDVRALETEFDTRANLSQLERWNGETLALVAPTAGQFLRGGAQLASISFDGRDAGPQAGMRTAALVVPAFTAQAQAAATPASMPAAVVASTKPVTAVATTKAIVAVASTKPVPAVAKANPAVAIAKAKPVAKPRSRVARVAVAAIAKPVRKPAAKVSAPPVVTAAIARPVAPRKTQTVAMLDGALLSDRTLGDLMSRARGEAGRLR